MSALMQLSFILAFLKAGFHYEALCTLMMKQHALWIWKPCKRKVDRRLKESFWFVVVSLLKLDDKVTFIDNRLVLNLAFVAIT